MRRKLIELKNGLSDFCTLTSLGNFKIYITIIDSAFNVNVQLTGYDYERNNVREKIPGARINKVKFLRTKNFKILFIIYFLFQDLVDASVVESHIVPHRLLFTSHAPTGKFKK